ncbi:hypothetical protein E3T55_15155 [Cryobacterium frigoriphilum]|uniref:Uncharacterized protein n=1 Tax=Cryobacterium frigoriphilum TaxID=1259150 RepID=A0A4R8ZW96_9MICO|nr:IgG-binding virulence factor TspB family protein [Cryobacterium frigoriphilum]TFD47882.1 hypothetical protein E3T55_15155 [Cryobacterium frigoriphilum]
MPFGLLKLGGLAIIAGILLTGCTFADEPAVSSPSATVEPTPTPEPTPEPTLEPTPDPIVDTGPAEGAMGPVETDAEGNIRYTTVDGDVGGLICDRFGRAYWQLERLDGAGGFDCHTIIGVGVVVIPNTSEKPW